MALQLKVFPNFEVVIVSVYLNLVLLRLQKGELGDNL